MNARAAQVVAHIPRLRRYALALAGDRDRADDLVQETLARALGRFGTWRRGSNLRAWLFTIMHNQYVNDCRAAQRRSEILAVDTQTVDPMGVGGAEDDLALDDIGRALARLAPQQRETLLLVSLEGLSYEEAAKVLGVKTGTVMSRLHRAREQLRALLEGKPEPEIRPGPATVRRIR